RLTGSLLSDGRSGGASRATLRLRHGFVVGQVVLAFVLLCGAGLLARSFENATAVEPGFDASRVATGRVVLPGRGYPDALSRIALADRLIASIARSPGVTHVGVATNVPLSGSNARSAARPLLDD